MPIQAKTSEICQKLATGRPLRTAGALRGRRGRVDRFTRVPANAFARAGVLGHEEALAGPRDRGLTRVEAQRAAATPLTRH